MRNANEKKKPTKKEKPASRRKLARTFYRLCGLDPARAENAIATRTKEDPASVT
jgi:hypothetical protein